MKKVGKGIIGAGVALAVSFSMMPVGSAYALGSLQSWQAPSGKTATTITKGGQAKKLITSASHKASEGTADVLGISNVTCTPFAANPFAYQSTAANNYYGYDDEKGSHVSGVSETARFGIYGSDVNVQKNPYYANYFYNAYQQATGKTDLADAKDTLLLDNSSGNPMMADTKVIDEYGTSAALYYRPDILLAAGASTKNTDITNTTTGKVVYSGDALTTTSGYTELVNKIRNKELGSYEGQDLYQTGDENYDPYYVTFSMGTYSNCFRTLYNLADSANAIMKKDPSKATRYGDPDKIAQDFEGYFLGTQDYVLRAIEQNKVPKKTVAVVTGVDTATNTITLATSTVGADAGQLISSSLENVTTNLAEKLGTAEAPKTEVTAKELMDNADDIYIAAYIGFSSGNNNSKDVHDKLVTVLKAGGYNDESAYPETFVQGPKTVIHARKGATDGVAYTGAVIGFAYPELINPIDATAYFYHNFYHVKESRLADAMGLNLASMSLPSGVELNLADYDEAAYQAKVKTGLAYYKDHKASIDSEHKTLVASDRLTLPNSIAGARVTLSKTSYTYTGKALEPTVSVSVGGTQLKAGTDYRVSYSANKNAGKATVTVSGLGSYAGEATESFSIKKAKGYARASKAKVSAKKKSTVSIKASGKVKLTLSKSAKKAGLQASGKTVTVKKGAKKGTYKVKAKVSASQNYKGISKTISLKVA